MGEASKLPGPGFYDISQSQASDKQIGSGLRTVRDQNLWGIRQTPSPGDYDDALREYVSREALLRIPSPAFKDKSVRRYLGDAQIGPGPGAYRVKSATGTCGGKTFARDPRFTAEKFCGPFKMSDGPSPDTYSTETELTRARIVGGQRARGVRFAREPGISVVGPGRYGKLKCDMLKPSYNVMFDPELKKKQTFKRKYSSPL
jgi:hypothetical protein